MKTRVLPLLLATLALVAGCSKPSAPKAGATLPAAAVSVARVESVETPLITEITGSVRSVQRATLAAKVMGTVADLPVTLGQRVATGELLLKLSAPEIDARVAQARAQLNVAARDLERERTLLAKGASTTDLVRSLEDRAAGAAAQLREAETMLGYTELRAPFAGVIARKFVDAGDLAAPGQPLLGLDGLDGFQIDAAVPDSLAGTLASGQTLAVSVPSTGRRFTGMVFATIGFSLKSGLALGSASLLWILSGIWGYETHLPTAPNALAGFRACSSIVVGLLFVGCVVSVAFCGLSKSTTLQISADLAERRRKAGIA